MNAYRIWEFNPAQDMRPESYVPAYIAVAVYRGRTAKEALTRFATDRGFTVGPHAGAGTTHWIDGRKYLSSFGQGQYRADKTEVPALVAEAV